MTPPADPLMFIRQTSSELLDFRRKGELGQYICTIAQKYGMYDLQLICGKFERDLRVVPVSYRNRVRPFMQEWIFGRYHAVLSMNRSGKFTSLNELIKDPDTYRSFCLMLPDGCIVPDDGHVPYPPEQAAWYQCFMYLMAGFAMYVLDEPGHPVGMPFPGGEIVRKSGNQYYCPIRDKEEEIFYSICNFCPALQEPGR
jgi:uncharacterized protein (UPF0305 family)